MRPACPSGGTAVTDLTSFDGIRLALTIHGPAGAPSLVLVHGLGLSAETGGVPRQVGRCSRLRTATGMVQLAAGCGSGGSSAPNGREPLGSAQLEVRLRSWGTRRTGRARAGELPVQSAASTDRDHLRQREPRRRPARPALDVPTLVLHGDADPEVPAEGAQALMSALPDAELVMLPGAGHVLPLTHGTFVADQVARRVTATMTETTPREAR